MPKLIDEAVASLRRDVPLEHRDGIARGAFATDEEMRALWAKHGP